MPACECRWDVHFLETKWHRYLAEMVEVVEVHNTAALLKGGPVKLCEPCAYGHRLPADGAA